MPGSVQEYISPALTNFQSSIAISSLSPPETPGIELMYIDNASASTAWTANLIIYIPLITTAPLVVSQFYWLNGATVNGNTDVGIYTEDGQTKVTSTGSTLNSGTSAIQSVDITNVTLTPDRRYWLALGSDSGTQTFNLANLIVSGLDFVGIKQQASGWSSGLPGTATFAAPSVAKLPIFGLTGASVV